MLVLLGDPGVPLERPGTDLGSVIMGLRVFDLKSSGMMGCNASLCHVKYEQILEGTERNTP